MPCVAWDLTLWRSASRKIDTGRVYSAQINIRYNTQMNTFHDSMSITTTGILKETNSGLICLKTVYLVVNSIDVDTHVVATHELLVAVRTRNVWEVARFACHAAAAAGWLGRNKLWLNLWRLRRRNGRISEIDLGPLVLMSVKLLLYIGMFNRLVRLELVPVLSVTGVRHLLKWWPGLEDTNSLGLISHRKLYIPQKDKIKTDFGAKSTKKVQKITNHIFCLDNQRGRQKVNLMPRFYSDSIDSKVWTYVY